MGNRHGGHSRANREEKKSDGGSGTSLLQSYTLGDVLGQGAFGVVYECAKKGSDKFSLAVKMVDKVETPLEDIKREAKMMKDLEHPNIVKFHAVYFEKCFVCIVMDKYPGGDLIGGMQHHWETKGQIPPRNSIHIIKGMLDSVKHLHANLYVHCDIKGDNYLLSTNDITDKSCKVFLSDFGTCVKLAGPNDRLKATCGTKLYWPPEFYAGSYSMKTDVFACGVICYGLCCGRFPFRNERDTKQKEPKLPSSIPAHCSELVFGMLMKEEAKRFTAEAAMNHAWLHDGSTAAAATSARVSNEPTETERRLSKEIAREGGANGGQDERRKQLLERMRVADQAGDKEPAATTTHEMLVSPNFKVGGRDGRTIKYEWYDKKKMAAKGICDFGQSVASAEDPTVDVETVSETLKGFGIDVSLFGKGTAKTVGAFAQEVQNGSALLMLDAAQHKRLVRVVDVIMLRISCGNGKDKKYLVEFSETLADGRLRENLFRLPGHKKHPAENIKSTVEQVLKDSIGNLDVVFNFKNKETFEEEVEESVSYPGVKTVYRKQIIPGQMAMKDLSKFGGHGEIVNKSAATGIQKVYRWLSQTECKEKAVQLRTPKAVNEVSALIEPPSGMTEEELTLKLEQAKIDPQQFGVGKAKSLRQFADELIKGEATLQVHKDGRVERIADIVVLQLFKEGTGEVLVESEDLAKNGTVTKLERLPATKRRPDENQFVAAQKVLRTKLLIDDIHVKFDSKHVQLFEERKDSHAYPGLTTLYRKRLITGYVSRLTTSGGGGGGATPACGSCFAGVKK